LGGQSTIEKHPDVIATVLSKKIISAWSGESALESVWDIIFQVSDLITRLIVKDVPCVCEHRLPILLEIVDEDLKVQDS
jgi:hypothetical protein